MAPSSPDLPGPRPVLSVVLVDDGSEWMLEAISTLGLGSQLDVDDTTYELLLAAEEARGRCLAPALSTTGVPATIVTSKALALAAARGDVVAIIGKPGRASPTLVASLCASFATFPDGTVAIRTTHGPLPFTTLAQTTQPENVALPRARLAASELEGATCRVQLVGDGFLRDPEGTPGDGSPEAAPHGTDWYFGAVHSPPADRVKRPTRFVRPERPRLSVVVVAYEMQRELPRTLSSLSSTYQLGVRSADYEIIVVDNGSRHPLAESEIRRAAPNASYHVLENPPPSPAHAINYAVERATGDALAIMTDGACLVSPGVLQSGLLAFRAFPHPVVLTRYFFLGPGDQVDTIARGYDAAEEDRLLSSIGWPSHGYRLFEIASPLSFPGAQARWLSTWFESNCLFLGRADFLSIGGCDERFDLPGGGMMLADLLYRACGLPGAQPVSLIGEAVFHQVHGGVTTNTSRERLDEEVARYAVQWAAIRGTIPPHFPKSAYYLGRLTAPACRSKMGD